MANKGLIVGRVYMPAGGLAAKGTNVAMTGLSGSDGAAMSYEANGSRKYIHATAGAKGEFAIPFAWSGADFGSGLLHAWATLVAFKDVTTRSGNVTTSMTVAGARPTSVKLVLFKDVAALLNTAGSSFKSLPETLDFAVDLYASLRKFKTYPVWKSGPLLTTESWLLCGGLEMVLS